MILEAGSGVGGAGGAGMRAELTQDAALHTAGGRGSRPGNIRPEQTNYTAQYVQSA